MKKRINKNTNQFTASMILVNKPETNYEEKLQELSSHFISDFVFKEKILANEYTKVSLKNRNLLQIGFAMISGKDRAEKAIELALSDFLVNNRLLYKSIMLLISSDNTKLELDEIGVIIDCIQEKSEYMAEIKMDINQNKNLGKALSVTIIISEL